MVDLDLISRGLDQAVSDAQDALEERRRNYAGYPSVGKFALYEDAVREAESARAEFAKLRKAMEEASERTVYESTGNEGLGHITRIRKALVGHRVLLVKADD